jgi:hypothetical protein
MGTWLLVGWGAGIMAASLTYPLDLIQTHVAAPASSLRIFYLGCKFYHCHLYQSVTSILQIVCIDTNYCIEKTA